jgi:hypothetical protein
MIFKVQEASNNKMPEWLDGDIIQPGILAKKTD